ncbi:MAG: DoxX family membrane protein [Saprospiraceae bacterium]|nr:DoxX family membrane protein [Saprospiraceae bacterium]MDW8484897.1 DoxX family membrane protein [Saprospiraceae bacterium]
MGTFLSLGRWIFPIPFILFGLTHFAKAEALSGIVPAYMPAKVFWVYLSGVGMIAAAVSMYLGKYDKLAATLLAIMLLLFVVMVHLPGVLAGSDSMQQALPSLLKDIALAAASMMYAQNQARDSSIVG